MEQEIVLTEVIKPLFFAPQRYDTPSPLLGYQCSVITQSGREEQFCYFESHLCLLWRCILIQYQIPQWCSDDDIRHVRVWELKVKFLTCWMNLLWGWMEIGLDRPSFLSFRAVTIWAIAVMATLTAFSAFSRILPKAIGNTVTSAVSRSVSFFSSKGKGWSAIWWGEGGSCDVLWTLSGLVLFVNTYRSRQLFHAGSIHNRFQKHTQQVLPPPLRRWRNPFPLILRVPGGTETKSGNFSTSSCRLKAASFLAKQSRPQPWYLLSHLSHLAAVSFLLSLCVVCLATETDIGFRHLKY